MTLPDINTAGVSWMAYWNFLDNGADSINPSEATSAMTSSEQYSNGVDGTIGITLGNTPSRAANCRVKDDGWIIVWISDDVKNEGVQADKGGNLYGPIDIINDWTKPQESPANGNVLANKIKELKLALGNESYSQFNHSDVGIYNYENPNATNFFFAGRHDRENNTNSATVTPSSDVELHEVFLTGAGNNGNGYDDIAATFNPNMENVDLIDQGGGIGFYEAIIGVDVSPGQKITMQTVTPGYEGARVTAFAYILWS